MRGGLVLSLAPGERVLVNGVMLENGDRPSSLRIADPDARVLRCRDALRPEEVTSPARRVYFAIQLFISGDLDPARAMDALLRECDDLAIAFEPVNRSWIRVLTDMLRKGNFYSALCHLKPILRIESELLARAASGDGGSGQVAA